MKNVFSLLLFFSGFLICAHAQEVRFGQVGTAILKEAQDPNFSDVPAKVAYKRILMDYGKSLEIHERIKIYNEEGFEFSNWNIPFSDISYLQGYTYNLENGVIEKTHVQKSSIFKEQVSSDYEITKVSFPKVKKGSVIELKYKVKDFRVNEIPIQYGIPIQNFRLVIQNVQSWMVFKQNPNFELDLEEEETDNEKLKIFTARNIPPSKEEPYVNSLDNYRGKLYIKYKSEKDEDEKWAAMAATLNRSRYFGDQLNKKPFFRDDIQPLIKDKRDTLGTAKVVYKYVQEQIAYNDMYSLGAFDMEESYKNKKGSKGEINLMLTAMLRDTGYDANPMIVACRHRGEVLFPERSAFNATICALRIGDDIHLLDASEKHAKFGVIPIDLMNDHGLIILEDGRSISYPTRAASHSVNNTIVTTKLDIADNSASGTVRSQWTEHMAWQYKVLEEDGEEMNFKEAIEESHPLLTIENLENPIVGNAEKPVQFSYDFTYRDAVENIAGNLYVSPFLFLGSPENQFDDEERLYPVDLEFPKKENFNVTFHIPEGYELESLPENKKISLQDNLGELTFMANKQGQLLQLRLSVAINYSIVPASYYGALRELFNEYTKISKSKIVLSKH